MDKKCTVISEKMLCELRDRIIEDAKLGRMSEKRCKHTLEVEKMAQRLAALYAPEKINILRAAALLHDVTKEYSVSEQIKLCEKYGVELSDTDCFSPKLYHAKTAAALLKSEFPDFWSDELENCIKWHTTGHKGMTLTEKIVYLADYIDMSRSFEDCVKLRNYFFDAAPENMDAAKREEHLDDTLIISYDITIDALIEKGAPISFDTIEARNELIIKKLRRHK